MPEHRAGGLSVDVGEQSTNIARRVRGTAVTLGPALRLFIWSRLAMWLLAAGTLLLFESHLNPDRDRSGVGDLEDAGRVIDVWARWDSGWYLRIAEDGYSWPSSTPAFFPLYPLLMRALGTVLGGHDLLAGVIVSTAASAVAFVLLHRLARPGLGERGASLTVAYLAVFPTTLFLAAVYGESLFLALAVAVFVLTERGRAGWSAVVAGLALLTRAQGVALLPVVAIAGWRRGGPWEAARAVAVSVAVFLAYPLTLWLWIDRPLAFLDGQRVWDRHLSPLGPLGGIVAAIGEGDAVGLGFVAVTVPLAIVAWRRFGAAYGSYAVIAIALPMSFPSDRLGGLYSFPRFALVAFPCLMALAWLTARRPLAAGLYGLASAALLSYYVVRWSLWHWVA
jgi:hypothetical protein